MESSVVSRDIGKEVDIVRAPPQGCSPQQRGLFSSYITILVVVVVVAVY